MAYTTLAVTVAAALRLPRTHDSAAVLTLEAFLAYTCTVVANALLGALVWACLETTVNPSKSRVALARGRVWIAYATAIARVRTVRNLACCTVPARRAHAFALDARRTSRADS